MAGAYRSDEITCGQVQLTQTLSCPMYLLPAKPGARGLMASGNTVPKRL